MLIRNAGTTSTAGWRTAPEFAGWYMPWLIFISLTAIPVYIALLFCWKVASNIGNDRSFSMDNARLLKWISWLAAADLQEESDLTI